MQRFFGPLMMLLAALAPAAARAQTLTIEMDAIVEAPPTAPTGAVVVVRPEYDARVAVPAEPPRPEDYATPAPTPPAPSGDDDDLELWVGLMLVVEGFDLSGVGLELSDPEIEALDGIVLGSDWAGRESLREVITGGVAIHVGMRAAGFLRGPELRLGLGGGDIGGELAGIQGGGMQLAVESVFYLRGELALGLQIPIGAVIPYVVATGSAGLAFVDVSVRDEGLGGLGTETIETGLFGAGLEAGVDVEIDRGTELGFAFRASFVGSPSLGGAFRVTWGGE